MLFPGSLTLVQFLNHTPEPVASRNQTSSGNCGSFTHIATWSKTDIRYELRLTVFTLCSNSLDLAIRVIRLEEKDVELVTRLEELEL